MNFVRISIYVVVAAAVVYFGLEHFFPHHKAAVAVEAGPSVEAVPAGSSEQTAGTPANQDKPVSEAEARKIAEDVGRKVGEEVAQRALEKQPPQPAAQEEAASGSTNEKPATAAASAAPPAEKQADAGESDAAPSSNVASAEPSAPPKAKHRPKAAPTPKPESQAPAEPKPELAPKTEAAAKPAAAPAPKSSKPAPPPPLPIAAPWWPPANQQVAGKLNLMFAGEASSDRAIALLFSSTFSDAAAAGSHIKVTDAAGKPVQGQWALAPNPRLLLLKVASGGRYNVSLAADLADAQGKTLTGALKGPVDVH